METESQTIAFDKIRIQEIKRENQKAIDDYITARKMGIDLCDRCEKPIVDNYSLKL
jgi:hypothetical protein